MVVDAKFDLLSIILGSGYAIDRYIFNRFFTDSMGTVSPFLEFIVLAGTAIVISISAYEKIKKLVKKK